MNQTLFAFKTDEAVNYLHREVVRKGEDLKGKSIVDTHGVIVGLILLNEELELIIQFKEGVKQYTKFEFVDQLELVDESSDVCFRENNDQFYQ